MVDLTDIALAVASFGPALLLLYLTLRDYTYPKVEKPFFDDRKVFALMTLGIVLGTVFFFVDSATSYSGDAATLLLIALAVAFLQGLIRLAILNWRTFQRKVDTAFYGLALGLGIAATYSFAKMFVVMGSPGAIGLAGTDVLGMSLTIMIGVQIVLVQGSTSAMIGVGCARGQPWSYLAYSMIYAFGFTLLLYGSAVAGSIAGDAAAILLLLLNWPVGIYAYWHVYRIDYPNLIDDAKRGFRNLRKK